MKMQKSHSEISAGGIIVSKTKGVWWLLLMKDRNGNWTFPKGKIEKGEDYRTAAVREIAEEVGIKGLSYWKTLSPTLYWYFRDGSIKKTVHYFLFESAKRQTPTVQTEEGITQAKWVRLDSAQQLIGYPKTNIPLFKETYGYCSRA